MRIIYENPKFKQSEIANHLGYCSSTLESYRKVINLLSPYGIQPNSTNKHSKKTSNTNSDNDWHRESDLKRSQMTSNDIVKPEIETKSKKKNQIILKAGSMRENFEINEHF